MTTTISNLLLELHHYDERIREKAARSLEAQGRTALFSVLETLGDADADVRERAIWILEAMADPAAVPGLLNQLDDPVSDVRVAAICALKRIGGEDAVDGIRLMLVDRKARVRREAARALGEMRAELGIASLVAALHDPDISVARAAAISLGHIRSRSAVRGLSDVTCDLRMEVRLAAIHALGEIGDKAAIPTLTALALSIHTGTRAAALDTMAKIQPRRARSLSSVRKPIAPKFDLKRVWKSLERNAPVMLGALILIGTVLICLGAMLASTVAGAAMERDSAQTTFTQADNLDEAANPLNPIYFDSIGYPNDAVVFAADNEHMYSFNNGANVLMAWSLDNQITSTTLLSDAADGGVFSMSGRSIAVIANGQRILIYNTSSGTLEHTIRVDMPIQEIEWSRGKQLSVVGSREVQIIQVETGEIENRLVLSNDVQAAVFSYSGNILAISHADGKISLYDLQDDGVIEIDAGHGNAASLAWNMNSNQLISAGEDGILRVWNVSTESRLVQMETDLEFVEIVEWSSASNMIAVASYDGRVQIWDGGTYELVSTVELNREVRSIDWSPNGEMALIGSADGSLTVIELSDLSGD